MAKGSGVTRKLCDKSREWQRREGMEGSMRAETKKDGKGKKIPKYSCVEFNRRSGGLLAIENSVRKHSQDEKDVARILSEYGYRVTLKDEAGFTITPDGMLYSMSYEQRTPEGTSTTSCNNCFEHAKKKAAEAVVIYDKWHKYHRTTIDEGLKDYEQHNSYRFKLILVIGPDGRLHRHYHNKNQESLSLAKVAEDKEKSE